MYIIQLLVQDIVMVIGGTVVAIAAVVAFCYIMDFIMSVMGAPHDE